MFGTFSGKRESFTNVLLVGNSEEEGTYVKDS